MGLIKGSYIAKEGAKGGFQAAGASLHNCMGSHGPDAAVFDKATHETLQPVKVGIGSLAFMFESCYMIGVTDWALNKCTKIQTGYNEESLGGLQDRFQPPEGVGRS